MSPDPYPSAYSSNSCRQRHTKCDRGTPACSTYCKAGRGRDCVYEGLKIRQSSYSARFQSAQRRSSYSVTIPLWLPSTLGGAGDLTFIDGGAPAEPQITTSTVPQAFSPLAFSPNLVQKGGSPNSYTSDGVGLQPVHSEGSQAPDHGARTSESPSAVRRDRRGSKEGLVRTLITDERESAIFHSYIKNAAPWLDIVSSARHLGQSIPRLALLHPVLLYACLAYASHITCLMGKLEQSTEELYQDKAIGLLIPLFSSHSEPWKDKTLLATTVILRMSKKFSELRDDAQHHLNGAFHSLATPIMNGHLFLDLRGVAFWIYLRKSIRICFLYEQGCRFDMDLIEDEIFDFGPDEAWTNRINYLLARTCNACCGTHPSDKAEEISRHHKLIEQWKENLPETFKPWGYCHPNQEHFPAVCHLSTWHIIG